MFAFQRPTEWKTCVARGSISQSAIAHRKWRPRARRGCLAVAPVAHPAVALATLDSRDILERHCPLEFDSPHFPWLRWQEWLASQGCGTIKPKSTLRFNQYDQVISAAIAEQGIALGRLKLLCPMLSDGRLRELMGSRAGSTTSYAYWSIRARAKPRPDVLTTPAGLCRRPKRANRIWMSSLVPRKVALTAHQASERYLQGRYVPIGFAQCVHGSVTFRRDRHGAVIQVL